jgi:CheY-like chemotaxis protein
VPGQDVQPLILIAVSHDDSREMYALFLLAAGFRVFEAATSDDALAKVIKLRPQVVITDLGLAGSMDGADLCATIKQQPFPPAIIILTAWTLEQKLERARAAGSDRVIVKPCVPDALLLEIYDLLARSSAA